MTPPYAATADENALCNRIIGAAFEAFVENGYAGTTTLEIATRAKVSKRDLYANFPNKQAVLLQCITNRAARMRVSPNLAAPRSREMLAQILLALGRPSFGKSANRQLSRFTAWRSRRQNARPMSPRSSCASRLANRNALAELLGRAQASGILGHGDPRQMMERFFGLLWGDLMLNRLLGAVGVPIGEEIDRRARGAAEAFLKLNGKPMSDATDGVGEAPSF